MELFSIRIQRTFQLVSTAYEIYKIYNHGEDCPYPEYQVEFERGTKFEITDIKKGKEYNVVHIKELPSQTI